ncbi:MAG: trigger factor [Saprospiraceae bacterium]|nr:hypothetical protein [Saprospiraceae bacterium]MCB9343596.1 hypothetical protein [Lewinellaceae bacterium]
MPTVVRQDLDNSSAILTVTVTREELMPKLESELKRYRKNVPIKGFRAGHVPMSYVKKMYGQAIFGDVLNDLLAEELYQYLRENKLDVLGQPLPSEDQGQFNFKLDSPDPEYAVKYDVSFVPDFELNSLGKGDKFERYTISDVTELAEEDLEHARKQLGPRTEIEDSIEEKDMVKIEARELDGDAVKEGGLETTISVLVETVADKDTKKKLLKLKKGDTLRFNARTLENHERDEMYRKYILGLAADDTREVGEMFEGTITEVSRVGLAELNEDFFKNYFGNDSITTKEAAIEEITKGVIHFYDIRSNALLMRDFQEKLMEKNKIALSEKFLKRWLKVTNEGKLSDEVIDKEYPAFADNLVWSIIRDKIKAANSLEVTDEELKNAFAAQVRRYFGNNANIPDNIIDQSVERLMEDKENVNKTMTDIETDKIFDALREQITVKDKAVPSKEFHKIIEEINAKATAQQGEDATLREAVAE